VISNIYRYHSVNNKLFSIFNYYAKYVKTLVVNIRAAHYVRL
jgi:hypothetical protein